MDTKHANQVDGEAEARAAMDAVMGAWIAGPEEPQRRRPWLAWGFVLAALGCAGWVFGSL